MISPPSGTPKNSNLMKRLQGIVKSRYGKDLVISYLSEIGGPVNSASDDLKIPMSEGETYLGMAIVQNANDLSQRDQDDISNLVKLALQPLLYNLYLKNKQSSLGSNVLNFGGLSSVSQEHEDSILSLSPRIAPLIVLEARNPYILPRLSLEVHHAVGRWAYLNYSEVRSDLRDVQDIQTLGAMTIFVEDILFLNPQEQDLLSQYLDQGNLNEHPLFIIGATSGIEGLIEQGLVNRDLGPKLLMARLSTQSLPQNSALLKESIQLILDPHTYIH